MREGGIFAVCEQVSLRCLGCVGRKMVAVSRLEVMPCHFYRYLFHSHLLGLECMHQSALESTVSIADTHR